MGIDEADGDRLSEQLGRFREGKGLVPGCSSDITDMGGRGGPGLPARPP